MKNKKMQLGIGLALLLILGIIVLAVKMPKKDTKKDSVSTDVAKVETTNSGEEVKVTESTNESTSSEAATTNGDASGQVENNNKPDENKVIDENQVPAIEKVETNTVTNAKTEGGTPVANHGKLSVKGTNLVDKNGNPFQIKGVSTHGIQWFPEYVNKDAFKTIRDEWGANCIRLAMYTDESGYCNGGDKASIKQTVNDGVSYATDLGMYVIIDWHILHDLDPNKYKTEAISFFDEMSKKYKDYDNVIYEICNEPNGGTTWSQVKSYAEEVIPVIKANNPDAIIIVGTPTWSQDVDQAAKDPIKGYTNIMYTIHFYAATHKDDLRNKMSSAIASGLPIFCTEFGICDASGNGSIDKDSANKWIASMNDNNVSYCIWNLSNKNESSSLISSGCDKKSGWTESELSEEGKWYVDVLNGKATGVTASSSSTTTTNNNNNNNSSNNTSSSSAAVTASSANTSASLTSSNSWDEGGKKCYQYTLTVKNTGSSAVKNWKVSVDFGTGVSINNSWNGTFSASGNTVTVTPADFNNEIKAGSSVEVGFIIKANGAVSNPTVTIN